MSRDFYEASHVLKKKKNLKKDHYKISRRKVTSKFQSKYFNNFRSPNRDTGKIEDLCSASVTKLTSFT